jgi:hypothetical protein
MELDELVHTYGLPEEVVEFCRSNNLYDLSAIQRQVSTERSFTDLPGCTPDVEHRLLSLITVVDFQLNMSDNGLRSLVVPSSPSTHGGRSFNSPMDPNDVEGPAEPSRSLSFDPDLDELKKYFGLTVRAYNICDNADLKHLSSIRAFSRQHGGFGRLRNCGISTRMELDLLLEKTASFGVAPNSGPTHDQQTSEVTLKLAFDPDLVQLRTLFGLSVRAFNVCENNDLLRLSDIITYGSREKDFSRLRNCGSKTRMELQDLVDRASSNLQQMEAPSQGELDLRVWAARHFVEKAELTFLFPDEGKMALLGFLERHFALRATRSKQKIQLALLNSSAVWPKFTELGVRFGISRERARQIVSGLDKSLKAQFALVADLPNVQVFYPELVVNEPFLFIDEELTVRLNTMEGTAWSPLFFIHLASAINGYRHKHVRWVELFGNSDALRSLDHCSPFMVALELVDPLQLACSRFIAQYKLKRKESEQYVLHPVLDNTNPVVIEQVSTILHQLISRCFPDVQLNEAFALLPHNVKRNQEDLLEEVLSSLDTPSHASRIQEVWNGMFPDRPVTIEGIRSIAVRATHRFISIGRTSTYGLRKWEDEREDLKGGTIRDIIEELLEGSSQPLHLEDLVVEVQKFRPATNLSSVRQNLQMDTSGRFTFLPGGYLGLQSRSYHTIPAPKHRVPGSLMRTNLLLRFIGSHRAALAQSLAARCKADSDRIDQVINSAIANERIVVDEQGFILRVASSTVEGNEDVADEELPFDGDPA